MTEATERPKRKRRPTDIRLLDLRVGIVDSIQPHDVFPEVCSFADTGVGEQRTRLIPTELTKYMKDSDINQKLVLVVCNLPTLTFLGFQSKAMILCAKAEDKVELLTFPRSAIAGERVLPEGYMEDCQPLKVLRPNTFNKVMKDFSIGSDLRVLYRGIPLQTKKTNSFVSTSKMLTDCIIKYL